MKAIEEANLIGRKSKEETKKRAKEKKENEKAALDLAAL
jgi:hypothetical protein